MTRLLKICSTELMAWSKTCLVCCQQFLNLSLESVENNLKNDLAGIADSADCTIVLTLLEVAFLW